MGGGCWVGRWASWVGDGWVSSRVGGWRWRSRCVGGLANGWKGPGDSQAGWACRAWVGEPAGRVRQHAATWVGGAAEGRPRAGRASGRVCGGWTDEAETFHSFSWNPRPVHCIGHTQPFSMGNTFEGVQAARRGRGSLWSGHAPGSHGRLRAQVNSAAPFRSVVPAAWRTRRIQGPGWGRADHGGQQMQGRGGGNADPRGPSESRVGVGPG